MDAATSPVEAKMPNSITANFGVTRLLNAPPKGPGGRIQ